MNNDFEGWSVIVRTVGRRPQDRYASLSYYDASREHGVPGLGSFQSDDRALGPASPHGTAAPRRHSSFQRQLQWWTSGFYQRAQRTFSRPGAGVSLVPQDTDNTLDSYGGNARVRWLMPWVPVALEASFLGQKETFHPESHYPAPTSGPDRWRRASTTSINLSHLYVVG